MPKHIVSDYERSIAAARLSYNDAYRILRLSMRLLPPGESPFSLKHWYIYDQLGMEFGGLIVDVQFGVWAAAKGQTPDSRDMSRDEIMRAINELPPKVQRQYLWFVRRLAAKTGGEG